MLRPCLVAQRYRRRSGLELSLRARTHTRRGPGFWQGRRTARLSVKPHQVDQIQEGHRLPSGPPVVRADLECDAPLREEHAIGLQYADGRVVNVRRFRRNAVQLEYLEAASLKVHKRRSANVEAAEVKAGKAGRNAIHG